MTDEKPAVRKSLTPRKPPKGVAVGGGNKDLKTSRCRRCQSLRVNRYFYTATDKILDTNGFMSVCSYCCNDLFQGALVAESGNMDKAFFKTCRTLNVRYDQSVVVSVKKELQLAETKGKSLADSPIFGVYLKYLRGIAEKEKTGQSFGNVKDFDFTFQPIDFAATSTEASDSLERFVELDSDREYLEKSWGKGLEIDDYLYLEESFAKWTRTTKCDTYAEELLVRELCHKENAIRKARLGNSSTHTLVKELQEIMKNSALTPALQNAASSGKNAEAFGVWVKDIENKTPAEWYEDQEKYRDIEGIEDYNQRYITRPIKNFITGSRDFSAEGLVTEEIEDEGD